jgi:hypothetical protein
VAIEGGYRGQPRRWMSVDLSDSRIATPTCGARNCRLLRASRSSSETR